MLTGWGGGRNLFLGKRGAFYYTLEEFHRYWERVDIILPKIPKHEGETKTVFGNVYLHTASGPLFFYPFWFLKKALALHRQEKFDLMTVHDFPPFYNGIAARILWQKTKIPYVLEVHHIPGYPKAGSLKEGLYKQAWKLFAKFDAAKAKAVRVVNQKETPDFLVKAEVPAEKVKYVPSVYIDLDVFRVYSEVEKKYDLVFASRLEKNKGIFNLIEAVKIAKEKKPNIKLLIIGQGPERKNLESRIKNLELENNISFSGWLETSSDVAKAYNNARTFVNPSFNEGGPRVALEAMACGLPIITTKVGLMHDLIIDNENGLFTDWNPKVMAEKIVYLLDNLELQEKFGQAGQVLAQQFERKNAIRNYAGGLQKLL